ncbi:hypothetical protein [Streptomyces sp. DH37]|uniref:hypothetical protein n=1 Tax=Streptomyces sp. DH37 TaxID=3040122 RepID=UPI002440EFDF|nr:hypothetical protein [Streptomyces sp. DH37]MDG9701356.1 hypothetical protein [Streptomyces sp. DH37]
MDDVLLFVRDGPEGPPDAVESVWPRTVVRTCAVRPHSPATGRFLSADPCPVGAATPTDAARNARSRTYHQWGASGMAQVCAFKILTCGYEERFAMTVSFYGAVHGPGYKRYTPLWKARCTNARRKPKFRWPKGRLMLKRQYWGIVVLLHVVVLAYIGTTSTTGARAFPGSSRGWQQV